MKKTRKHSVQAKSATRTAVSRRHFLGSVAAGVGASSLLQSKFGIVSSVLKAQSRPTPQRRPDLSLQDPGIVTGKQVLTASDFQYAGLFTLPAPTAGVRFGYSSGAMTARRVGGTLQFLVTGVNAEAGGLPGDLVYEVSYPGYGSSIATAPRAALIRTWGDVYQGKRLIAANPNVFPTRGLHWANDQLYWAYGDFYNVVSNHDPSIGTSVLNADGSVRAYGPWRTQEHSQKTRGYMLTVPAWFTQYTNGSTFAVGAPLTSSDLMSPWGAFLAAAPLPSNSTPADVPRTSHVSIACQRLIYHDINNKQRRDTNYNYCDYNVKYDASRGGYIHPGSPEFTLIDTMSAAAWIDLPTKHGVVFLGQLASTIPGFRYGDGGTICHVWYGIPTCVHGQSGAPASRGTGPAAGTMVPYLWVYDPADLVQSAQGRVKSSAVDPSSVIPVSSISTISGHANAMYMFGGAYFDALTSTLFVSQIAIDWTANPYESQPVVHVFKIRG
jgi:hypothetical protein